MRPCPGCARPHEEGALLCKPCQRSALGRIRKDAREREEMLQEVEPE